MSEPRPTVAGLPQHWLVFFARTDRVPFTPKSEQRPPTRRSSYFLSPVTLHCLTVPRLSPVTVHILLPPVTVYQFVETQKREKHELFPSLRSSNYPSIPQFDRPNRRRCREIETDVKATTKNRGVGPATKLVRESLDLVGTYLWKGDVNSLATLIYKCGLIGLNFKISKRSF